MKVGHNSRGGYLWGVEILTGLLLGLAAAAGATLFPGLQNMAGVSVSLRAGRRAGYAFSLGMALAFTGQAALAVFFAGYFTSHPAILTSMKWWAAPVFFFLAGVFIVKGYRVRVDSVAPEDRPYHGSPLARGILLALMNLLVVPYFFALGGWLLSDGHLDAAVSSRLAFILGAGAGAMIIYGTYARLANWMNRRVTFLTRNINFLLGGILLVIALVQSVRLYL